MNWNARRWLSNAAFTGLLATMTACGASQQAVHAPADRGQDPGEAGSPTPDPASTIGATKPVVAPPANEIAKASAKDDGSDIIPPFSSGAAASRTSAKAAAGSKAEKKDRAKRSR